MRQKRKRKLRQRRKRNKEINGIFVPRWRFWHIPLESAGQIPRTFVHAKILTIPIDCLQQRRAVPRCQRTYVAEYRLVYFLMAFPFRIDTVGWAPGRATGMQKLSDEVFNGVGVVICLGSDLQNILRPSYDNLTIMPKLRSTYDGRLIHETSYSEWKAFHGQDLRAKS